MGERRDWSIPPAAAEGGRRGPDSEWRREDEEEKKTREAMCSTAQTCIFLELVITFSPNLLTPVDILYTASLFVSGGEEAD